MGQSQFQASLCLFLILYLFTGIDGKGKKWRHEDGSVEMFRYLREDNDIDLVGEFGLDTVDVIFIEEIISGTKEGQRKGRDKSKFFLYGECRSKPSILRRTNCAVVVIVFLDVMCSVSPCRCRKQCTLWT